MFEIVQEWRNACLVPVPKKGDFSSCDRISLLDVVGKDYPTTLAGNCEGVGG